MGKNVKQASSSQLARSDSDKMDVENLLRIDVNISQMWKSICLLDRHADKLVTIAQGYWLMDPAGSAQSSDKETAAWSFLSLRRERKQADREQ